MITTRNHSNNSNRAKTVPASSKTGPLDNLTPVEAQSVLRELLNRHSELRHEAEAPARGIAVPPSIEEIADEVFDEVTGIGLDALNERAGSHSWGYVEPGEAAAELLEESLEDFITDMNRQTEAGLNAGAEAICAGLVEGLYRARDTKWDGALGWAPDFPGERACQVLEEFLQAKGSAGRSTGSQTCLARIFHTCSSRDAAKARLARRPKPLRAGLYGHILSGALGDPKRADRFPTRRKKLP